MKKLRECHTEALGSPAFHCDGCGDQSFRYGSCPDRHCPTCSGIDRFRRMNLHIHCQTPHKHCHSPGAALRYLSRYIVGAAIHNARFLEDDGNYVTIRVKSYRKKRREIFKTLGG